MEALTIAKKYNDIQLINDTHYELGAVYCHSKQPKKAIPYLEFVLENTKENKERLWETQRNLGWAYVKTGNIEQGYPLTIKSYKLENTLQEENNIREATQMEKDFEFKQERKQTELLHQAEIKQERTVKIGLGIGLGLLGLLAFFIFRSNRIKAKTNQLLEGKNEEISKQKEALERSNYTKDRLFAILGHDLRKPAVVFQGIARKVNYLLKKEDYNRIKELGESIENNALGLTTLTDNLLNWALTQKDALSIHPEELDINDIIKETTLVLGRLAEAKNIQIVSEVPKDTKVLADKNSMLTIVRNLVDNAIKYTPDGGMVTIIAEDSKAGLDLTIKDTGIGIPEDRLNSIFLLQDDKSTKGTNGEKGTGLGLHLVQELVNLNKGDIKVVSTNKKGTSFIIQLPKVA